MEIELTPMIKYCAYKDLRMRIPHSQYTVMLWGKEVFLDMHTIRALGEVMDLDISLRIILSRIRENLIKYEDDSWVGVKFHDLKLDMMTLFLFIPICIENLTVIARGFIPDEERRGLKRSFNSFSEWVKKNLTPKDPLADFLCLNGDRLKRLKQVRNDICHRVRRPDQESFPDFLTVMRAGGGKSKIMGYTDIRSAVAVFTRILLCYSCLIEDLNFINLKKRFPDEYINPPGSTLMVSDQFKEKDPYLYFLPELTTDEDGFVCFNPDG